MYCPKPCTCTVYTKEEIEIYNNMREPDTAQLIRFPVEKVKSRTNQEIPNSVIIKLKNIGSEE